MSEQIDNSDMNNDIEINDKMQLTLPAIQLKYAGRVFRAYNVKLLGDRAAYRVEESLKVDLSLIKDAFVYIRNPNKELKTI